MDFFSISSSLKKNHWLKRSLRHFKLSDSIILSQLILRGDCRFNGSTPFSTFICTNIKSNYFLFNSVSALGTGALLENHYFSNFKSSYPFWQLPLGSPLLKATVLYTSPFKYHCVESSIPDSTYLSSSSNIWIGQCSVNTGKKIT